VATLVAHGIDRVFCVAGESYLPVLDALYDTPSIDVVTCRHEGSGAFMALADAKLSGRAGVCLVNRGPGATNACIALHSARQDASPLVLVVGHVKTADIGRRAFQEVDYAKTFSDLAKGVYVLLDPATTAEVTARALRVAEAGTPGPTVLVVPEDVLSRPATAGIPAGNGAGPVPSAGRWEASAPEPSADDLKAVESLLGRSSRPLLLAGGRLISPSMPAATLLREVAERHVLPVAAANKRQDVFDNTDPHYAGHLHVATRERQRRLLAETDLLLAVGTRLDHVTTREHTTFTAPVPAQPVVHVYPDPEPLGFAIRPTVGLWCDPLAFLTALRDRVAPAGAGSPKRTEWLRRVHAVEAEEATWRPHPADDGMAFGAAVNALEELLPPDAVVCIDAGNFTSWVHRYHRWRPGGRLMAISSSAMGFGIPSGVAAAIRHPERTVVAFVGDGGFLMTGGELATAVQRGIGLTIVVANNGSYGTIRHHQERSFPGRVIATDLTNPDFAALARAYGALGVTVAEEDELAPALRAALAHPGPAVVDVLTSLTWISANQSLADIRPVPVGEAP
jgi:acetolactate synthase I/II/III large subunit